MIKPFLHRVEIFPPISPKNIDNFSVSATAYIGTDDGDGADIFEFKIMTPNKLISIVSKKNVLLGKNIFIVNEKDMQSNIKLVEKSIIEILNKSARDTWEEVALSINCYLEWEYYDPETGISEYYKTSRNL